MARIDKSKLTKLEIVRVASKMFLEKGYSNTSIKAIASDLEMSTGNLTFHFQTKEHLLAELVEMLCSFQWKLMEDEAKEGVSSLLAVCLELMSMASACEESEIARDFFVSTYQSSVSLEIIRKNDAERSKSVYGEYCEDWTDEQFNEAEILVSGIEYATLMTTDNSVSLESRIVGALDNIMKIYDVPEEIRKTKIKKVLAMDYKNIGGRILKEFIGYVHNFTENALKDILNG